MRHPLRFLPPTRRRWHRRIGIRGEVGIGLVPHANEYTHAEHNEQGNRHKPQCQSDLELIQHQAMLACLLTTAFSRMLFHRPWPSCLSPTYIALGVGTPSKCKPLRSTIRTADVSATRAAVSSGAS